MTRSLLTAVAFGLAALWGAPAAQAQLALSAVPNKLSDGGFESGTPSYFAPSARPGHALFDLNGYTIGRLAAAGVDASFLDRCTYGEEELFYSYRRATHRGEADYGRQISAIVLED
jgi:copper oxidase (laccase) domain-containing protein